MDEDPAGGVRRKKDSTLVRAAEAVRDGKASAMISAGNTGATMAVGAAADGPHQGRQPPGDRHADPGAGLDADRPARRRRQRRGAAGVARAVRPDGHRCTPATASAWPRPRSACCRSARSRARATRCARRRSTLLDGGARHRLHRQRRGPRHHDRRRRRRRHRRVHRQRRAEDARGRRARRSSRRCSRPSPPTAYQRARRRAAAGAAPAVRHARPRHLRRRRAARRRRRVHHLPRLERARRRCSTRIKVAEEMVERRHRRRAPRAPSQLDRRPTRQ